MISVIGVIAIFQRIEEFHAKYDKTTSDLESLHTLLLSHKSLNPSEVSQAMKSCEELYTDVQLAITRTIEMGRFLYLVCIIELNFIVVYGKLH